MSPQSSMEVISRIPRLEKLSMLQIDILAGIGSGNSISEIGSEINYSYAWVKANLAKSREILGAKSNSHAVVIAQSLGLLLGATGVDQRVFPFYI